MRPSDREERLDWAMAVILEPVPADRTGEEILAAGRTLFDELSLSITERRFARAEMIVTERLSLAAERLPAVEWSDVVQECARRLYHEKCYELAALLNGEASFGYCRARSYGDALACAERAVRLAGYSQDEVALALGLQAYGACLTSVGDYPEARRKLDAVEVPAERPDILFLQALLEAWLEAITLSDGYAEAAQTAFRVAHRFGLKPSRCSIAAVLLAGALRRKGLDTRSARYLIPGLEYLLRNRFERLLTPFAVIVIETMQKVTAVPTLGSLCEPLEAFIACATTGFPTEELRSTLLLALRAVPVGLSDE